MGWDPGGFSPPGGQARASPQGTPLENTERCARSVFYVPGILSGISMRHFSALATLAACLSLARAPRASAAPESISLRYEVGVGCPPANVFVDEFRSRATRYVLIESATPEASEQPVHGNGSAQRRGSYHAKRRIRVTVSDWGPRSFGRLELYAADELVATRDVDGPNCAEVASALAFVTALAVAHPDEPEPGPATDFPATERPADELDRADHTNGERSDPSSPAFPARPRRARPRWHYVAGAHALAVLGVLPEVTPGVDVFVDLTRTGAERGETGQSQQTPIGPSYRLSLRGAASQMAYAEAGKVQFRWAAGAVDLCPWGMRAGEGGSFIPCASIEGGVLNGILSEVSEPGSATRPWFSVGATGRVRWALHASFSLEVSGQVQLALWRDKYTAGLDAKDVAVHDIPLLGGILAAGFGFGP